jgi:hypothetical protein
MVDTSGKLVRTGGGYFWQEFPYYDENPSDSDAKLYWKVRWFYTTPPRKAGEAGQAFDPINFYESSRVAYQYLPGQRRTKLAPEIAFDVPTTDCAGNDTWDEQWIFNASMERYNWKLIGKKEMYVPYNNYRMTYWVKQEELFGPKHFNPDIVRWELHRVWVVEASLKPGKRHIYKTRRLYIDEDSWTAVAGEMYDAYGSFFKIDNVYVTQNYDFMAPCTVMWSHYNMTNGAYVLSFWPADGGYIREGKVQPERWWSPSMMSGLGVR